MGVAVGEAARVVQGDDQGADDDGTDDEVHAFV